MDQLSRFDPAAQAHQASALSTEPYFASLEVCIASLISFFHITENKKVYVLPQRPIFACCCFFLFSSELSVPGESKHAIDYSW